MNDVRRDIEGIAGLEHPRRFAIDQERELAIELIAEFMGVGMNVPWHRGAGREGIDLDIHFLAGLAREIRDEDLLGLDFAGRLRSALGKEREAATPATTRAEMRAFLGVMAMLSSAGGAP